MSLVFSCPSYAITGNDLIEYCTKYVIGAKDFTPKSPMEAYQTGRCTGYIDGMADLGSRVKQPDGVCVNMPSGVEYSQITSVVVKWLREHPQKLQEPAPILFYRALQDAWPCQQ